MRITLLRRTFLYSNLMLLALLAATPLFAQSSQLAESQKAVVSFDFRFDALKAAPAAQTLEISEKIKNIPKSSESAPDMDKVKRVYGALSAPEDMESAQTYRGDGPLPVEFFARIEMEDVESANVAFEKLQSESEVVEMAGKTFYKPTKEGSPENVMATKVDDTTIEFGTTAYITRADRKVFSEGLTKSFGRLPNEAMRIAIDMEGASGLIETVVATAKESAPPNFAPFIDLLDAASDLRISMDLEGSNLLTIGTTGKSESQAEDLEGGLNSLVGLGQAFGGGAVQGLKQQSEELGTMVETILENLQATREGDNVTLAVPRPEGFAEALKTMER